MFFNISRDEVINIVSFYFIRFLFTYIVSFSYSYWIDIAVAIVLFFYISLPSQFPPIRLQTVISPTHLTMIFLAFLFYLLQSSSWLFVHLVIIFVLLGVICCADFSEVLPHFNTVTDIYTPECLSDSLPDSNIFHVFPHLASWYCIIGLLRSINAKYCSIFSYFIF